MKIQVARYVQLMKQNGVQKLKFVMIFFKYQRRNQFRLHFGFLLFNIILLKTGIYSSDADIVELKNRYVWDLNLLHSPHLLVIFAVI